MLEICSYARMPSHSPGKHFGLTGPLVASGARIRIVRLRDLKAADSFDAIRDAVSPRTRLIALSHVAWTDGRVMPWRELRDATGIPVLVDGAQGAGAIPVDAGGADFYTVSAQKWLCGPDATGALVVRDPEALRMRLGVAVQIAAVPRHPSARVDGLDALVLDALADLQTFDSQFGIAPPPNFIINYAPRRGATPGTCDPGTTVNPPQPPPR